ncbi:MAG: hypothetical protein Q9160_008975 [Pyrenula sp. 1 TL-2023]
MSSSATPYQAPTSPRGSRWCDIPAQSEEVHHGPFPDVVTTAGAHLVTQPPTPVLSYMGTEQWARALHQKLDFLLHRQEIRYLKYGKDNAEEWPMSHTPPELKEPWLEHVRRQQWIFDNPGPPTPDDEYGPSGVVACGSPTTSRWISQRDGLGLSPSSKGVKCTSPSDPRSKRAEILSESKSTGGESQQPSPPSTQPTPSDSNFRGKKRKERASSSSSVNGNYQRDKRRCTGAPESTDTLAKLDGERPSVEISQESIMSQAPMAPTQDAGPNASLGPSITGATIRNLKRKRTDEIENASASLEQQTESSHAKRKRTEEPDSPSQYIGRSSTPPCTERQRVKEHKYSSSPCKKGGRNRPSKGDLNAKQKTQSLAGFTQASNDASFAKAKKRQAKLSKGKFIPLKEAVSSSAAEKTAKDPAALRPSKTTNKSLRSKLKQLAKTGIGAG